MISILSALAVLVCGYLFYGRTVEKVFGPDGRQTPAYRMQDGVDFVPMKPWKGESPHFLAIKPSEKATAK